MRISRQRMRMCNGFHGIPHFRGAEGFEITAQNAY